MTSSGKAILPPPQARKHFSTNRRQRERWHSCRLGGLEHCYFEKGETRDSGTAPPETQSERKNDAFSATRQAVRFETHSVSTENALKETTGSQRNRPRPRRQAGPKRISISPAVISLSGRTAKTPFRETVGTRKATAPPRCPILPNKARWGGDGGV